MSPPVSLVLPPGLGASELVDRARRGEEAGFQGVFLSDRFGRFDALSLLGALASATDRVRVGTLVLRAAARPAWTIAHAAWTAQALSGGRVVLGLGAADGSARREFEAAGLEFPGWRRRVVAVAEAIEALGRTELALPEADRPPVWVGGRSTALRRLAAQSADGWNLWGAPLEELRRAADEVPIPVSWSGRVTVGDRPPAGDLLSGSADEVAGALSARLEAGARELAVAVLPADDPGAPERFGEAVLSRLS